MCCNSTSILQRRFLEILPRIKQHARIYFRSVRCQSKKADAISEVIALAWKWFIRLAEKGKDATEFPSALASLAARSVNSGRRLCGMERAKDVMSHRAQSNGGFVVATLPATSTLEGNEYDEALHDNTRTPVPEQVSFRIDLASWLSKLTARDRKIIKMMAKSERTLDIAKRFNLSPARISQLRQEYKEGWEQFISDRAEVLDKAA